MEPKEFHVGTSIYTQSVKSPGDKLDLWLAPEVVEEAEAVLWDWAHNLQDLTLTPGRYSQNWIEF